MLRLGSKAGMGQAGAAGLRGSKRVFFAFGNA